MPHAVHDALRQCGLLYPVKQGGAEERLWLDCDLACFAEHRLGDKTSPHDIDASRRALWQTNATLDQEMGLAERSEGERCCWIMENGQRQGTLALETHLRDGSTLKLASFYVFPSRRGQGVGHRTLAHVQTIFARHKIGIRLDTHWSWQRTVRFYVGLGMWIHHWRHDLTFGWDACTPKPRIAFLSEDAQLSVPVGDGEIVLLRAHRDGDTLILHAPSTASCPPEKVGAASLHASSTLALSLALHGFPLIRSAALEQRHRGDDHGPPEALAHRIAAWEAWERKQGWAVNTPRIPGLAYPSWDALQAQWARAAVGVRG